MFRMKKNNDFIISEFHCQRDSLTIRGTEYRPMQAETGMKLPVAVVCHGFMAFQDTVRQYTRALAEAGYVVYCFDFCGGSVIKGKSDGRTTDMSVLTEVRDLEAVMDFVQSSRIMTHQNFCSWAAARGASFRLSLRRNTQTV